MDVSGQPRGKQSYSDGRVANLVPRDASDVFRQATEWLSNAPILIGCLIATQLLASAVLVVVQSTTVALVAVIVSGLVNLVLLGVVPIYANRFALQEANGGEPQRGGHTEFLADLRVAGSRFLPLFGIAALHGVIGVVGVVFVLLAGRFVLINPDQFSFLAGTVIIFGSFVVALLGMVYLFARLSMAVAACVLDDKGFVGSISLSWQVSRGNVVKLGLFVAMFLFVPSFSGGAGGVIASSIVSPVVLLLAELSFARVYLAERPTRLDSDDESVHAGTRHREW